MLLNLGADLLMKVASYLCPGDIFHMRQVALKGRAMTENDPSFIYNIPLYRANRDGSYDPYPVPVAWDVSNDVPQALTHCLRNSISTKIEEAFEAIDEGSVLDFLRDVNKFGRNHVIVSGSLMVRIVTGRNFDNKDIDFFCDEVGAYAMRDYLMGSGYKQTNLNGSFPTWCTKMSKTRPNGRSTNIDLVLCSDEGIRCRDLVESFDMLICACSFNGYCASVPMPVNTFSGTTVLNRRVRIPFRKLVYLTEKIPKMTRRVVRTYVIKSPRLRKTWKRDYNSARRNLTRIIKYKKRGIKVLMPHRVVEIEDGMDVLAALIGAVGRAHQRQGRGRLRDAV